MKHQEKSLEELQHYLDTLTNRNSLPEVFCKKGVRLRPATLLKKRLWYRCFPVNLVKFLRTPSFIEHLWCLLQYKDLLFRNTWRFYTVKRAIRPNTWPEIPKDFQKKDFQEKNHAKSSKIVTILSKTAKLYPVILNFLRISVAKRAIFPSAKKLFE